MSIKCKAKKGVWSDRVPKMQVSRKKGRAGSPTHTGWVFGVSLPGMLYDDEFLVGLLMDDSVFASENSWSDGRQSLGTVVMAE